MMLFLWISEDKTQSNLRIQRQMLKFAFGFKKPTFKCWCCKMLSLNTGLLLITPYWLTKHAFAAIWPDASCIRCQKGASPFGDYVSAIQRDTGSTTLLCPAIGSAVSVPAQWPHIGLLFIRDGWIRFYKVVVILRLPSCRLKLVLKRYFYCFSYQRFQNCGSLLKSD